MRKQRHGVRDTINLTLRAHNNVIVQTWVTSFGMRGGLRDHSRPPIQVATALLISVEGTIAAGKSTLLEAMEAEGRAKGENTPSI